MYHDRRSVSPMLALHQSFSARPSFQVSGATRSSPSTSCLLRLHQETCQRHRYGYALWPAGPSARACLLWCHAQSRCTGFSRSKVYRRASHGIFHIEKRIFPNRFHLIANISQYTPQLDPLAVLQSDLSFETSTKKWQKKCKRALLFKFRKCVTIPPNAEASVSFTTSSAAPI